MLPHPSMYVVDLDFAIITHPIIAHRAVMGFSFTPSTHLRHSSHTLFTAHASRTHVKALQTDLHAKPDNSSGPAHDSPSERPLRTKDTFQPKTAPKSIENTKPEEEHPSPARTNSPPCPNQIGTKARRAVSKPRRHQLRCSEPWEEPGNHQVRFHGSMPRPPNSSRLGSYRSRLPIPLGRDWLASGTPGARKRLLRL